MEWLEADLQLLYLIVALGGLPFAAGVLLLRFGGKLLGTQLHWSQGPSTIQVSSSWMMLRGSEVSTSGGRST